MQSCIEYLRITNQTLHGFYQHCKCLSDSKLTFRDYISEKKINKAYSVLGIIKRNFIYMDEHTFVLLYIYQWYVHMLKLET